MKIFTLLLTGFFFVFCSYCYGKKPREVHIVQNFHTRPVVIYRDSGGWTDSKAAMIAEIWNIRPDELATAANIFGE